jgi:hypothetical protein
MTEIYVQPNWRYCNNCFVLFFDGYESKGSCKAGGGHAAAGYNFWLFHSQPAELADGPNRQSNWRFCNQCFAMYFAGHQNNSGACPASAYGHNPQGFNFSLNHDVPEGPLKSQPEWRNCGYCQALVYNGYNLKGKCAGRNGGEHISALGMNFRLLYEFHLEVDDGRDT